MPKSTHPVALSDGEVVRVLKQAIFAIESIAHLRGLEKQLLPHTDGLRKEASLIEKRIEADRIAFARPNHG